MCNGKEGKMDNYTVKSQKEAVETLKKCFNRYERHNVWSR